MPFPGNLMHYKPGMAEYGIGNAEGVLFVDPKNAIVNEVFAYMMDKIGTLQNLWPMQVMSA